MSDQTEYSGQQQRQTSAGYYNTFAFICQQLINKVVTLMLVQVTKVSNDGEVSPVGTVSVTPLVNQISGDGTAVPHGTLVNVPYMRMQGGTDAIIMDPKVGDIGLCAFCMRDISAVKNAKGQANPGSSRKYDWADGLYLGGFLNGAPEQYVRYSSEGITIVSPTKITLQAPDVEINADNSYKVNASTIDEEASDSITINSPDNDIKGGGTKIDNKPFLPHTHNGVVPGGGTSGPVT